MSNGEINGFFLSVSKKIVSMKENTKKIKIDTYICSEENAEGLTYIGRAV